LTTAEDVMSRLNATTRKKVQIASETSIERFPVPSVSMTKALGGGLAYNRQALLWGNRSSGKSSLCLQMIGNEQKKAKVCAWIDAEESYDPAWATRLGVDSSQLILSPIKTIADMANAGVDMLEAGVDILVIDSISALLSDAYFNEGEMKDFDKTRQIGNESKEMKAATRMLNYANQKTAIIYISQVTTAFGQHHSSLQPTGGVAVQHFSTAIIKLWAPPSEKEQIMGKVSDGDYVFEKAVGRKVTWVIEKNKIGPPMGRGEYDFYYDGDHVGVDTAGETLDLAVKLGKVSKGGSWYTVYGEQFQGRIKAVNYLHENPEILEKLAGEL
jgi:recombination protein RecA